MIPSADNFRSASAALAVSYYYQATKPAAVLLGSMLKVSWPEDYKLYRQVFEAGKFQPDNEGAWLARAIVHKLQVDVHRDGLDPSGKPTASFPMGYYSGGELYFPDLGLKLR
jgi:hypothetical protein